MTKRWIAALATCLMAGAAVAQGTLPTGKPAFDPRGWKGKIAGPPTEVLVLGSQHLSSYKDYKPEWNTALLDKLAAFRPTVIAVENLSGQACDTLRRYPTVYPGVYDSYCTTPDAARAVTGLDVATAYALMETTLASWPRDPSPAARRRLASVMLAAGEGISAYVQWLRLPVAERRDGDGLDSKLVKQLEAMDGRANESIQLGARLAARMGLERVHLMDDHSSDAVQSEEPAFGAAIKEIWSNPNTMIEALRDVPYAGSTELLGLFRAMNSPEVLRGAVESDFGRAIAHRSDRLWGRQYVAWYETRNLRMAANIRAAFARTPGARVLTIVGVSHKPYLDAYLDQMHEVRLVDAEAALR